MSEFVRTESAWVERTPTELAQAQRKALLADYRATFTTDAGKRVLEDLRKSTHYYRSTVERDRNGSLDALATLRNEGARALVVSIEGHVRDALTGPPDAPTHAVSSTATREP